MNDSVQSRKQPMVEWLHARAAISPLRPALRAGDVSWSFAEFDREVTRQARQLAGGGVQAGDRVAVLMENGAANAVLVHALVRLGAVLVPLNVRLSEPELLWQIEDVGVGQVIVDSRHASFVTAVARELPEIDRLGAAAGIAGTRCIDELAPAPDVPLLERIDLSAVQSVIYTSGTTGQPKGAMLTFGNHWWSAIGSALNLGIVGNDRWLACLPLFHVGGLSILWRSVIYGIPAVIHERFDPAAVNREIDDGATIVSVVAAMLQRMVELRGDRAYPPTLRAVLLGGGPAPRPLLDACARLGVPAIQTYGLTETASQVATLAAEDALRKIGSAGKPLLPVELRIVRDGRVLPAGEVGEIVVRGPIVTPGYVGRPDATARAIRDGWLHTGDLALLDDEGYLFVLDRRDDLILSGGENVYPAEVEAVLLSHGDVAEAGVMGVPDTVWGQVVEAVVVVRPNATVDEKAIIAYCATRLARYKLPVRVRFAPALPRNAAGKLLRRLLRETGT